MQTKSDERESAAWVMAALEWTSKAERRLLRAEQAAEDRLTKARARLATAEARVARRRAAVAAAEATLRERQAARAAGPADHPEPPGDARPGS